MENQMGQVKISEEVICTIASLAATEVEGVFYVSNSLTGNLGEMLGKKNFNRGIKVQIDQDQVDVEAYILVSYGSHIPSVCEKVQKSISHTISTTTGLTVRSVNVNVQGVTTKEEKAPEVK